MKYDYVIPASQNLTDRQFDLACGYCTTTSFLFEKANFSLVIDCSGVFTFYSVSGEELEVRKANPMEGGRECYRDVLITTSEEGVTFKLPDYEWIDHYPNCDGESDRWSVRLIGILDEIFYPALR